MSTYQQKIEEQDKNYQYLLFAAEPYDTIAFKIPNEPIDKDSNKLFTHWNDKTKDFTFQMFYAVNDGTYEDEGMDRDRDRVEDEDVEMRNRY